MTIIIIQKTLTRLDVLIWDSRHTLILKTQYIMSYLYSACDHRYLSTANMTWYAISVNENCLFLGYCTQRPDNKWYNFRLGMLLPAYCLVRSRYCAAFSSSIMTMLQSWWIATLSSSHFLVLLSLIIISRQLCLSLDVVFTSRSQVMSTSFWNIVLIYGACSYQFLQILITTKNNLISTNFLVWKFCGKTQFPHSFWRFAVPVMPFHKISTPGN